MRGCRVIDIRSSKPGGTESTRWGAGFLPRPSRIPPTTTEDSLPVFQDSIIRTLIGWTLVTIISGYAAVHVVSLFWLAFAVAP